MLEVSWRSRKTCTLLIFLVILQICTADQKLRRKSHQHDRGMHKRHDSYSKNSKIPCDPSYNNQSHGSIIQLCRPGYYKERAGSNKGHCVPCQCNGLSKECDQYTGKCLNCQFNTAGDHCERCKEGYYGNTALRTCRVCPCPISELSNSFALGCLSIGDEVECLCKQGYSGSRCERCALGYYGDPLADGGSCQPCSCDNSYFCDPKTGKCELPEEPSDDCFDCDSCVQTLLNDLEGMDDELSRLKSELESINNKATAHIDLKKLLDAIAATKVLVSMYSSTVQNRALKVKELDADMENVKEDLSMLKHETNKTFSKAHKVLQKVDHTNDRSQALLSAITDLLRRIQELLDKVKDSINTSAPVAPEEVIRMLKEAQQMLEEMRRQNCRTEWKIAEEEQGKADKLLDYIKKHLADHLDENKTLVDQIAQSLMDALAKLQDLAEALKHAEKLVQQAQQLNEGNEAGLKDILKRRKQLESEQSRIPPDLSMARDTLRETEDLQKMLDDLKKEYEKLAAQLDGARNDVPKKLNELSLATSKEGLVRQAEEHAQSLFNLAMDLQMALQNISNNSAVQKASEAVKAYTDVINAIREAKAAAEKATQAADQAVTDVKQQDLAKRTMVLKDAANKLLEEATQAQESLKMAEQNIKTQSDRLNRAKDKSNNLKRDIEALEQNMKKIKRDDIAALLDMAKQDASAANSTVNNVTEWVKNISAELNKTVIPSAGSNLDNILNEINKTLTDLNQSLPTLTDTLAEVKNQSQRMPDSANLQDDIRKIKEMIENTRDMVNRVRGPMLFSGNGHVELRPPKNLEDLKAFTALSLMMQRANTDPSNRRRRQGRQAQNKLFVLYLGNKQSPKDYIGMYLEKDVLYCVFKLGGIIHEIKTNAVTRSATNNAFMDKVDFHRVYQDAEVLFTTAFTSATPQKLPPKTLQSNTTVGLLDLDPDDVVFYVGGYPTDFTPPEEINLPPYRGCIEFSTFNDQILGLYNFKQAVNITDKDKCLRGLIPQQGNYFDGTGYGRIQLHPHNRIVQFSVRSRLQNALLYYMGNEDSYYTVSVERGKIVLRRRLGDTIDEKMTPEKVFPVSEDKQIRIKYVKEKFQVQISGDLELNYTHAGYDNAYIGGVPTSIRERYNIIQPPLRGCVGNLRVGASFQLFVEEVGVIPGCFNSLLGVREGTLDLGSSLFLPAKGVVVNGGLMVSLGFKSTQTNSLILQRPGFQLSLVDGFVEMADGKNALRSNEIYNNGEWHYLTAFRNESGLELTVDNKDMGKQQPGASPVAAAGDDIILGKETFSGCIQNLYTRGPEDQYLPADLSAFIQKGNVTLGVCVASQHLPRRIMTKERKRKRNRNDLSGVIKKAAVKDPKGQCEEPAPLIQAYSLDGVRSQLQYNIDAKDLNYRPHFSLDVRTKSSEGLLLHIFGRRGVCMVALYMANGKVKLMVGRNITISHHRKINNGDWHNIRFSVEKDSTHMLVDGFRVPDGKLAEDEGFSLDLQPPVYIGGGQVQPVLEMQRKSLPHKRVIGCIRDIKFYNALLEPAVNHGVAPCFDGDTEKGAYFAGDRSYVVLEKFFTLGEHFNLAFEIRPRNLMGLLFHAGNQHGHNLTVFMKKGKLVAQVNDGAGDYSASVPLHHDICDGTFHHVIVAKQKNTIKVEVDLDSNLAVGPSVHSYSTSHDKLHIGGIPDTRNGHKRCPVCTSFTGCLRNLHLNGKAISLKSVTGVSGPVSLHGCPKMNTSAQDIEWDKHSEYRGYSEKLFYV